MPSTPGWSANATSGRSAPSSPGSRPGRSDASEITTFDSTGLAIQDLAIAIAAFARADELELPSFEL